MEYYLCLLFSEVCMILRGSAVILMIQHHIASPEILNSEFCLSKNKSAINQDPSRVKKMVGQHELFCYFFIILCV